MKVVVFSLAFVILVACSQPKSEASKQYPVTGSVVSIDKKERTATINAAAIPNYMDAMKMDYPIAASVDIDGLRVGESITATINVSADGSYNLSDIHDARK